MKFSHDRLTRVAAAILEQACGNGETARRVAERLIIANLTGHDSHGVGMVPKYVEGLLAGELNPNGTAEVVQDKGSFLLVDGQRGFGQVVAEQAMELAIKRARSHHFALLSLRNAFHIGRIGDWAEMAASAGFISTHYVNVLSPNALVAPFGGSDARFSTNPYCTAIPATETTPMFLLDMATSTIAHGKARVAHLSGKQVSEGALIDATGAATTDPSVMFEEPKGALTTFGQHKGFGLAMLGDILGGAFSGGGAHLPDRVVTGRIVNNMMAVLIDPDVFGAGADFAQDYDRYVAWVKASPPAPGTEAVMMPGDPERRARELRQATGIPVDTGTWGQLLETGETVGLTRAQMCEMGGVVSG
ncbi:malate/lactate/ureidoglycolate dehydrogenase [Arenibacterium sp. CAU 1754]